MSSAGSSPTLESPFPYGPGRPAPALRSPVLLVKPPMAEQAYGRTRARVMINVAPMAGFAALGGPLLDAGARVEILDLDLHADPDAALDAALARSRPALIGFTSQTAIYPRTARLARRARRAAADWGGLVALGGPHASAVPEEPLASGVADVVVVGEGEEPLQRLVAGEDPCRIAGVGIAASAATAATSEGPARYVRVNPAPEPVADLDRLPLPAWALYDLEPYARHLNYIYMRRTPFANVETTRGCHYTCTFCQVGSRRVRAKSAERVVREFEHAAAHGFREVHVVDDLFNYKLARAKEVCRALIDARLDLPWSLDNGIRVDAVDEEFVDLLRRAGCWQVAFGLEAGDDAVLSRIRKGTTTAKGRHAVQMFHRGGIETFGFFLLGLPGDDEATVRKTIRFARELPLDWASFRVPMPYPGTPLHDLYRRDGILRSTDWESYVRHDPGTQLYDHPGIAWSLLRRLERSAYRSFYLRPSYAWRRLKASIRAGTTLHYARQALRMSW